MNKTYIALLSSLMACTSMGMDKFPSLLELATKGAAKWIDDAVLENAKALKESGELTEANVHEDVKDAIACIDELPSNMKNAVTKAYRELHTKKDRYDQWVPMGEWPGSGNLRMNGYHDKIAVIRRERDNNNRMHLCLFTESPTGWQKERLGEINGGYTYAVFWGKDNELILLNEQSIHILPTPDEQGFNQRYVLPYQSAKDCFHTYHRDLKILAIEKRLHSDRQDKSADVALLHIKDNALQIKQIIPCGKPIDSIFMGVSGANQEDGEIVQIWSEKGKRFTDWREVAGVYKYRREHFSPDRSSDGHERDFICAYDVAGIEKSSEISGISCVARYLIVERKLIPLYEIPKKIIESLKDTSDQEAEPVDDILKDVL